MKQCQERGLVEADSYPYLQGDPQTKKHIKAKAEPLEHRVLVDHLRTALQLMCFSNFLGCFHPLRKITVNLGADILPWTMQIQNRNAESQKMHMILDRLARNACWHLIACTMLPASLGRSPLAKLVDKMIKEL